MHSVLRDNLEGYLSGALTAPERQRIEGHVAECPSCRPELEDMIRLAREVRTLRPAEDIELEPAPGFYARVLERIERDREVPFWMLLLEPSLGRRLVFACLMLLALLGAYVGVFEQSDYPSRHRPEAILAGRPAPPVRTPRLGPDLNRNRQVVLVTLVSGD